MTGSLAVATIPTPHIEYGQLSPMLVVFSVAVVGVLAEAFLPRERRRPVPPPSFFGNTGPARGIGML